MVNRTFVHGDAREMLAPEQLDHLLDGAVGRDRYHLRPWLHRLAHRFAAELDHRLDQVAIAFLDNAFFLSGFNQGVNGFGGSFRWSVGALAGERGDGLAESEHQRHRQDEVNQQAQEQRPVGQPAAAGSRKKDEGQQAVKNDDDQHQAERGLEDFVNAPGAVAKDGEADDHGNGGGDQLRQNGHGERGAGARDSEARLDDLLEGVDVVLELAREEFANLLIETVHVGDQRQLAEPETDVEAWRGFAPLDSRGRLSLRGLAWRGFAPLDRRTTPARGKGAVWGPRRGRLSLRGLVLSIKPRGRWSFARNCFSRRAISPLSHS